MKKLRNLLTRLRVEFDREGREYLEERIVTMFEEQRYTIHRFVNVSRYVTKAAVDAHLSMSNNKLVKMEMADLKQLRILGQAVEELTALAAIMGEKYGEEKDKGSAD